MTKQELMKKSPETLEFLENLGEADNFLRWDEIHRDLFISIVETANMMAQSNIPIEKFREKADEFFNQQSDTTENEDMRLYIKEQFLPYVERLRNARS